MAPEQCPENPGLSRRYARRGNREIRRQAYASASRRKQQSRGRNSHSHYCTARACRQSHGGTGPVPTRKHRPLRCCRRKCNSCTKWRSDTGRCDPAAGARGLRSGLPNRSPRCALADSKMSVTVACAPARYLLHYRQVASAASPLQRGFYLIGDNRETHRAGLNPAPMATNRKTNIPRDSVRP